MPSKHSYHSPCYIFAPARPHLIIQFLHHTEIDKQRWDECVKASPNSLVYAHSFYLDNMCPGWSAVVGENYEWVLPLTSKKKLGISYLYQPPFTQQTGVFAKDQSTEIPWKSIIQLMQEHFKFWEISFNYATPVDIFSKDVQVSAATNFILPLQQSYAELFAGYHGDLKRNLRRSEKFRLVSRPLPNHSIAIEEYIRHYGDRMLHVSDEDYTRFKIVADLAATQNMLICRQAVNQQNELMAMALLLHDGKRLYNLMNTTTAAGRKAEANHFLIDAIIREFAGSDVVFDFEGSDLPGVKSFYMNFGANNQPYYLIRYNNLPWPINLFKR